MVWLSYHCAYGYAYDIQSHTLHSYQNYCTITVQPTYLQSYYDHILYTIYNKIILHPCHNHTIQRIIIK